MTLYEILTDPQTGVKMPCAYSHFRGEKVPKKPPYMVYIGEGQNNAEADNTYYYSQNRYQIEYYFIDKDEEAEARIEQLLLSNGFLYEKSEDVFIESEGVSVIYYTI